MLTISNRTEQLFPPSLINDTIWQLVLGTTRLNCDTNNDRSAQIYQLVRQVMRVKCGCAGSCQRCCNDYSEWVAPKSAFYVPFFVIEIVHGGVRGLRGSFVQVTRLDRTDLMELGV